MPAKKSTSKAKHSKRQVVLKSKDAQTLGDRLLHLRRHWVIVLVLACFALASGMEATSWGIGRLQALYHEKVAWKAQEEKLLQSIGPNMQVGYVKQILGEPVFQDGGNEYKEYIFRRRAAWVQVVADQHDKVQLYSVAVCRADFKPKLTLPSGKTVVLMQDTLASAGGGDTYYFVSGATANSYIVEAEYLGNPSRYQKTYLGDTDSCGSLGSTNLGAIYDLLSDKKCIKEIEPEFATQKSKRCLYDVNDPQIMEMRKNTVINTVSITAPMVDLPQLRPSLQIGPDRVELRVLPDYRMQ